MEKKNYNLIPERIEQINKMLEGKHVDSILDNKSSSETDFSKSEDIRDLMPKKYIDFSKKRL